MGRRSDRINIGVVSGHPVFFVYSVVSGSAGFFLTAGFLRRVGRLGASPVGPGSGPAGFLRRVAGARFGLAATAGSDVAVSGASGVVLARGLRLLVVAGFSWTVSTALSGVDSVFSSDAASVEGWSLDERLVATADSAAP